MKTDTPHQNQPVLHAGEDIARAGAGAILLHGRGASAEDIIGISDYLQQPGLAWLAPQAADHVWYPERHFSPLEENEPWLSSAFQVIEQLIGGLMSRGIPAERIFFGGFSQGACISVEFALRHPRRWGGIFIFSGSFMGPGEPASPAVHPEGSFEGTPVLVACGDPDPYFDAKSVHRTAAIFSTRGAAVEELLIPGIGHTIGDEAMDLASGILERTLTPSE
jgi:phospholipase/carboxylesterase